MATAIAFPHNTGPVIASNRTDVVATVGPVVAGDLAGAAGAFAVLAHSMGGLVARAALLAACVNHGIGYSNWIKIRSFLARRIMAHRWNVPARSYKPHWADPVECHRSCLGALRSAERPRFAPWHHRTASAAAQKTRFSPTWRHSRVSVAASTRVAASTHPWRRPVVTLPAPGRYRDPAAAWVAGCYQFRVMVPGIWRCSAISGLPPTAPLAGLSLGRRAHASEHPSGGGQRPPRGMRLLT